MIMAATRERAPELERRMVLTSAGPVKGCMDAAAMTISGRVFAIASSFGRALKGLDTARADGREHDPHQRKHGRRLSMTATTRRKAEAPTGFPLAIPGLPHRHLL